MIDVIITKYALTSGVFRTKGIIDKKDNKMLVVDINTIFLKPDWHTTIEKAREQVLRMIEKKEVSLNKQYKKLCVLKAQILGATKALL